MQSKKVKALLFLLFIFFFGISNLFAQVWVGGYYRTNGTYVIGHHRTYPDGNPYNNYSFPGNYNPNTGEITPGNPSTYLRNYYSRSTNYNFDYDLLESNLDCWNRQQNFILQRDISAIQSILYSSGHNLRPIESTLEPDENTVREPQHNFDIYGSGRVNGKTDFALRNELEKFSRISTTTLLIQNEWLKGSWTGTGYEVNYDASWPMQISFTGRGYFVKYKLPECAGEWSLKDIKSDKIIFQEKINVGLSKCVNNGTVIVSKVSDNKIKFKFYYQNSDELAAHAYLTKE